MEALVSSSSASLTSRSTESMEIDGLSVLGNSPLRLVTDSSPLPSNIPFLPASFLFAFPPQFFLLHRDILGSSSSIASFILHFRNVALFNCRCTLQSPLAERVRYKRHSYFILSHSNWIATHPFINVYCFVDAIFSSRRLTFRHVFKSFCIVGYFLLSPLET